MLLLYLQQTRGQRQNFLPTRTPNRSNRNKKRLKSPYFSDANENRLNQPVLSKYKETIIHSTPNDESLGPQYTLQEEYSRPKRRPIIENSYKRPNNGFRNYVSVQLFDDELSIPEYDDYSDFENNNPVNFKNEPKIPEFQEFQEFPKFGRNAGKFQKKPKSPDFDVYNDYRNEPIRFDKDKPAVYVQPPKSIKNNYYNKFSDKPKKQENEYNSYTTYDVYDESPEKGKNLIYL